jgi:DNA primase
MHILSKRFLKDGILQRNIVEEIKEKADIVEVIGRIASLRKSGRSWSGLCPFHTETDGSFHVYDDSQTYYCFGCRASGDVITFYEKHYHLDFKDACERLCSEYGIEWKPDGRQAEDKGRDALYEINRDAGKYYHDAILKEGNPGLRYLLDRDIDIKMIQRFRIGYTDAGGRAFAREAESAPEKLKAAEDVGLVYNYSGEWRDRYRGRVLFPIVNTRGKVIGFGGRDITGEPKAAKYINSKESRVFSKGSNLYALYNAQQRIRETGFAILVEGYMDVVALHMHGVTNTVAQLGTAFTAQQAKLLSRYTKNVVLALDSDDSGQKAAEESADILRAAGFKVHVLVYEGAKDPDEFIRAFGREAFEEAVRKAVPMIDFKLARLKSGFDTGTAEGMADYLKASSGLLGRLEPIEADIYIQKLARDTGVSEGAIRMQTEQQSALGTETRRNIAANEHNAEAAISDLERLQREVLACALKSARHLNRASEYRYYFSDSIYSPILSAMLDASAETADELEPAKLAGMLAEDEQILLEGIAKGAEASGVWTEEAFDKLLRKMEIAMLRKRETDLRSAWNSEKDEDGRSGVFSELEEVLKRKKTLEDENRKSAF